MKKSHSLPIQVLIYIGTNLPFITWESKGKMRLIMEFHEIQFHKHIPFKIWWFTVLWQVRIMGILLNKQQTWLYCLFNKCHPFIYMMHSKCGSTWYGRSIRFRCLNITHWNRRQDLFFWFYNWYIIWKWLLGAHFAIRIPWQHNLDLNSQHS